MARKPTTQLNLKTFLTKVGGGKTILNSPKNGGSTGGLGGLNRVSAIAVWALVREPYSYLFEEIKFLSCALILRPYPFSLELL